MTIIIKCYNKKKTRWIGGLEYHIQKAQIIMIAGLASNMELFVGMCGTNSYGKFVVFLRGFVVAVLKEPTKKLFTHSEQRDPQILQHGFEEPF